MFTSYFHIVSTFVIALHIMTHEAYLGLTGTYMAVNYENEVKKGSLVGQLLSDYAKIGVICGSNKVKKRLFL